MRHNVIFSCIVFPKHTSTIERKVLEELCSTVAHALMHVNELKPLLGDQCLYTSFCERLALTAMHENVLLILK